MQIINTFELFSIANWPGIRAYGYFKLLLQFIQQIVRIDTFPVHFIYKDHNRSVSHPAYLHQLSGLFFHPLDTINHKDNTVNR